MRNTWFSIVACLPLFVVLVAAGAPLLSIGSSLGVALLWTIVTLAVLTLTALVLARKLSLEA